MLPDKGVTAEQYDRMPEELCRGVEIVNGRAVESASATPRHNRIARMLANSLEDAAPAPWQVTTDVDLRISDVPLHNRRPDVLVFSGDPDELPVRPQQVLLAVEIMSKGSISTDRVDKPAEYAIAGITHYWRIEQNNSEMTAHIHILDRTRKVYDTDGVHSGTLKLEHPFPVTIDLDALG